MKHLALSLGILLLFVSSSCNEKTQERPVETPEIYFTKEGELQLIKAETDSVVANIDIEVAESDYEIQTGLMYRESMEETQGMLFLFPRPEMRSFFMKNTRIPLDILFIDENKRIVSIQKEARPFDATSLPSGVPAQYVLELNAGLTNRWNIHVGDKVEWQVEDKQ